VIFSVRCELGRGFFAGVRGLENLRRTFRDPSSPPVNSRSDSLKCHSHQSRTGQMEWPLPRSLYQVEKVLCYKLVDVMVTAVVYAVNGA
jgi:hypothetical protein